MDFTVEEKLVSEAGRAGVISLILTLPNQPNTFYKILNETKYTTEVRTTCTVCIDRD